MSSRNRILAAVEKNQPDTVALPILSQIDAIQYANLLNQFESALASIGGKVCRVQSWDDIKAAVRNQYTAEQRILSLVPELEDLATNAYEINPAAHHLADVELAIIQADFGVAENGAVWVTESLTGHRAVPFICQHLAAVLSASDLVNNMHEAYQLIADAKYTFGTFIAGPSKTADIEQSLVLGAHGPRSMTVYVFEK